MEWNGDQELMTGDFQIKLIGYVDSSRSAGVAFMFPVRGNRSVQDMIYVLRGGLGTGVEPIHRTDLTQFHFV